MKSITRKTHNINFLFFSILYLVFINTFSAGSAYSEGKGFVPPIIVSDYNRGNLFTNIGGLSGGDEEPPGTTHTAIIPDDNFTKGNSGFSLMLDYDVSGLGEYSFYWLKLGKQIEGSDKASEAIDLTDYNYFSFWIRGSAGNESVKIELHQDVDGNGIFTFGTDITNYVYANAYIPGGVITKEWKKVFIPLKDLTVIQDWSKMLEFVIVFENRTGNKEGAVYIDDIMFGYRDQAVIDSEQAYELKAPLEETFRVNDLNVRQCLNFSRANDLKISAQSIKDDPMIESVSFEYSSDGGTLWRTIGADYDVSDNGYSVTWYPKTNEVHKYQVRAVATDIKGNEKTTGVLIDCGIKPLTDEEFLELVEQKAFQFFIDHQDLETGLFSDASGGGDASIASTGFGLTALCIGAKRGWISRQQAGQRVLLALRSFVPEESGGKTMAAGKHGLFYHFLDIHTGKRAGKSEVSTVDTAILVCGALTAGEFFGGEIKEMADQLYRNVNWQEFLYKEKGPWFNKFSMGWSPERGYLESYWDYYTDEAILICLLAIGSPTHPVDSEVFYSWDRHSAAYKDGEEFIYTWHGALFSYQYAHVWFDLRNLRDKEGVNWFENSKNATLANRQFCIDNKDLHTTFGENTWGITSMARPEAYTMHFGPPPTGNGEPEFDGTISPTGPAGSIIFTPYNSLSALKYMYLNYPKLWGKYGFRDSYNLDKNWYAQTYYGIGEAMYLIPVENFRSGFVWGEFMKNRYIKEALKKAGFTKTKR